MPNPLDALKKATTIGPDPLAQEHWLRGEMPLPPVGVGLSQLKQAIDALRAAGPQIGGYAGPVVSGLQSVGTAADDAFKSAQVAKYLSKLR